MKKSLKNFEEIKSILSHKDLLQIKGGTVTNQCAGNQATTITECNEAPPVPYDYIALVDISTKAPGTSRGRNDVGG